MTPFDFWSGVWRSGAAMAATNLRLAETMQASGAVIDSRTRTMRAASRDPLNGDYAELGRMVPEKMTAFSMAGMAAFADLQALQTQALAQWGQMMGIAARGRAPTMTEMNTMTTRSARMANRAASAGGKALAPIHSAATGNARRLAPKPSRKS